MRSILRVASVALLATGAFGQTLITFDGLGTVHEFAGPPDPTFCNYPAGPAGILLPTVPLCGPGLAFIPPGMMGAPGGVAYDPIGDVVFVSDGMVVEYYTASGMFLDSFFTPLPVHGMGWDAKAAILYATDGAGLVFGMGLPPIAPCWMMAPLVVQPFPVLGAGPLSGVDWDPFSGSLWVVDQGALVHNVFPGGAPGPISPVPFAVAPGPCWPAPGTYPYLRLAVDDASPFGPGHLYISDSITVYPCLPPGGPAPPTFAFPGPAGAPCFPTPWPHTGFAFSSRGVVYGSGFDPDGFRAPVIGTVGAAYATSPTFAHTLTGAVGSAPAMLVVGTSPACPAFTVVGVPSYLSPFMPYFVAGTYFTSPGGMLNVATPLPGTLPIGIPLFTQWFVTKPFGPSPMQVSDAASFRIALP
jgi:hypothetical protein